MQSTRNFALAITAVGGICLGAAAVGVSQQSAPPTALPAAPIHSPDDLSTVFRDVSRRVLPAIVSITSEIKPVEISRTPRSPRSGATDPREEFLKQFFGDNFSMEDLQREQQRTPRQRGAGSGFIVDKSGIIITNNHVVSGADRVTVTLDDGREYQAESWKTDARSDLAIIRIKAESDLPTVPLGDSGQMEVGDWVLAFGNPLDVGTTVTQGIISAKQRGPRINQREEYLQTDAAINPGNSGGPLVNLHGEVIGVNTAIASRSGGYDGIGFAIPSNNVRWIAEQLMKEGSVKRSYLGVALQPLTNDLRRQLNVPLGQGALVAQNISKETPGAVAGIVPGDVIIEFEGTTITSQDDLVNLVERSAPDQSYSLKIIRGGKEQTLNVVLKTMPDNLNLAGNNSAREKSPSATETQDPSTAKLGLQLIEPTADDSQESGKSDAKGLIVRGVTSDSAADEAGIRVGDIILAVSSNEVNTLSDFAEAVKDVNLDNGLLLRISRGGAQQFVVLKSVK